MGVEDLQSIIQNVSAKKEEWSSLPPQDKLNIIDSLLDNLYLYCEMLQTASLKKRDGEKEEGEYATLNKKDFNILQEASKAAHWVHSSMLISNWLAVIREYFDSVVKTGAPPGPLAVRELPGEKGQGAPRYAVKVGPKGLLHTTMVTYGTMELIVEGPPEQEALHRRPPGLTAVLGAGNFDGPVDLLTALFIDNHVCIYKLSPFNDLLAEPMKMIFSPLIEKNYLNIFFGDAKEGQEMLNHPLVDKWYMTGAAATAYKIIWGAPTPPSSPKEPILNKPFVAELGNCTPWIVCPGQWSHRQLRWHAAAVAAGMTFNGAHICVHPQVLITCKNWPQREEFLELIRSYIKEVRYVGCYYPDFLQRMEETRAKLISLGKKPEEFEVPVKCPLAKNSHLRNIIFAVDLPQDCFFTQQETFSPSCGEICLDTPNLTEEFLPVAVSFVNNKIHGGLSVSVLVKTNSQEEEKALEKAICDLQYGAVHINVDSKLSIAFPYLVWGGCPGSTIYNLNSGIGFLGNCFGYKNPVKSVVRAPFLNFTHLVLAAPSGSNAARMAKLWRRITFALINRRSTQSWWNFAGGLTKIATAFAANL